MRLSDFREVEAGELTVILNSGPVIRLRGFDFSFERPQPHFFVFIADVSGPQAISLVETYADKLRRGFDSCLFPVIGILCASRLAEIGPTVIERIIVFMVDKESLWAIHNLPVHRDKLRFFGGKFETSEGVSIFEEPFEIAKTVVILQVEDCEFAFAEVNSAESVAEAEQAIGEQWTGEKKVEPVWNFDLNSCHFISLLFFSVRCSEVTPQ
jgi:hypothetical protein